MTASTRRCLPISKYQDKDYDAIHPCRPQWLLSRNRPVDGQADLREAPSSRPSSVTGYTADGAPIQDPAKYPKTARRSPKRAPELSRRQELVVGFVTSGQAHRDRSRAACVHVAVRQVGHLHGRTAVPRRRLRDQAGAWQQGATANCRLSTSAPARSCGVSGASCRGTAASRRPRAVSRLAVRSTAICTHSIRQPKSALEKPETGERHSGATVGIRKSTARRYAAILAGYGGANPIWGDRWRRAAEKVPARRHALRVRTQSRLMPTRRRRRSCPMRHSLEQPGLLRRRFFFRKQDHEDFDSTHLLSPARCSQAAR